MFLLKKRNTTNKTVSQNETVSSIIRLNTNQLGSVGKFGEDAAADYLINNGFSIVERNIKFNRFEIDIIAEDDAHIVFAEVKTRTVNKFTGNSRYGPPSSAVTYRKQMNTVSAAREYLRRYKPHKFPRLDVIEVYVNRYDDGKLETDRINHIRNAFPAEGRYVR